MSSMLRPGATPGIISRTKSRAKRSVAVGEVVDVGIAFKNPAFGICNPSPWNPGYSQPHASSADTASLLLANRSSVRPSNIASERSSRP